MWQETYDYYIGNRFLNLHLPKDRAVLNEMSPIQFSLLEDLKILVVDNKEDDRVLVQMIFEYYRVQVKTAPSADLALEIMKQWQPNILISDIWMNQKDGYWLIRSIREQEVLPEKSIAAIAVTSYIENPQEALNAGYQSVILKPFEPDELLVEVALLAQQYYSIS